MRNQREAGARSVEPFWTSVMIGVVLLVATLTYFRQAPRPSGGPKPMEAPVLDAASALLATGEEPIAQIFIRSGCASCHTIPGIEGAQGRVGPHWSSAPPVRNDWPTPPIKALHGRYGSTFTNPS